MVWSLWYLCSCQYLQHTSLLDVPEHKEKKVNNHRNETRKPYTVCYRVLQNVPTQTTEIFITVSTEGLFHCMRGGFVICINSWKKENLNSVLMYLIAYDFPMWVNPPKVATKQKKFKKKKKWFPEKCNMVALNIKNVNVN